MCGIVGLFAKSAEVEARLGVHLAAMLEQMSDRGPDSAGVAVYRDPAPYGSSKLTLFSPSPHERWGDVGRALADTFGGAGEPSVRASHAVFVVEADATDAEAWVRENRPDLRVMSAGSVIEIYKETGLPHEFVEQFALADFTGTHALGHTRMATESRVTTAGSHPFSTGLDLCLVHNGSLSNHNRLRENLRREGIEFQTENDTEVAAGYLAWRMREGASLETALEGCLEDLDGFYTFAVGHRRRLRRAARPDRVQARSPRRDGRLGRDGLRVAGDLGASRGGPGRDVGAGAGRRLRLGEGRGLMAAVARERGRGGGGRSRVELAPRAEPAPARPRARRRPRGLARAQPERRACARLRDRRGHRGRGRGARGLLLRRDEQARDGPRPRQRRARASRRT